MTPTRLREALTALYWSQRALASILGVSDREVRRWAAGDVEVPERIAVWLDDLAGYAARHPPPVG